MNSNSSRPEKMLRPWVKRMTGLAIWDAVLVALYTAVAPSLITGFIGLKPYLVPLYLAAAGAGLFFFRIGTREDSVLHCDRLLEADGALISWVETIDREPGNPFLPVMQCRVNALFEESDIRKLLPLKFVRRAVISLTAVLLLIAALTLPEYFRPAPPQPLEVVSEAARRLSEAAGSDPGLLPLADELARLGNEKTEDPESLTFSDQRQLDELSRNLTEHIRELERNALSMLFDDKEQSSADQLERLREGEMTLPETRELILDLLSSSEADSRLRESITNAYRDFSEKQDGKTVPEQQQELADQLLDGIDPEGAAMREDVREVLEALDGLVDETAEQGSAELTGSAGGAEPSQSGGAGTDAELPEDGRGVPAAGSAADSMGDGPPEYQPWEGEQQQARLPEGVLLRDGAKGALRIEGDEVFSLQRISPDLPSGAGVTEKGIYRQEIPEGREALVRNYFISIGTEGGGRGDAQ